MYRISISLSMWGELVTDIVKYFKLACIQKHRQRLFDDYNLPHLQIKFVEQKETDLLA